MPQGRDPQAAQAQGPARPKQSLGGMRHLLVAHFGGRLVTEGQRWVGGACAGPVGAGNWDSALFSLGLLAIVLFSTKMGCFDANWL